MKFKLENTLSLVAVGVLSVLQGAHAAPVYEIKNLDTQTFNLDGTIANTRNGYGMAVNNDNEAVGIAKGKKKLTIDEDDDEDGIIDIEDGVSEAETITYSVNQPIVANNFTFTAIENDPATPWLPQFESINGTTAPTTETKDTINSVDAYFFGINDHDLTVGAMTAVEQKRDYTGSSTTQEYWYYREYEQRGFVKDNTNTEIALVPQYNEYVSKQDSGDVKVDVGGFSSATAVNSQNLVAGYASTGISQNSANIIDACVANNSDTAPTDICVQSRQYPNINGIRDIQYQLRGYVWQYDAGAVTQSHMLPLGLTIADGDNNVYSAQGLGLNTDGVVVGRSHVYRQGDTDQLFYDAAYWDKDTNGDYQYHWVDVDTAGDVFYSIAYDINDNGILVGSYNKYINGFRRDKFFYFDTKNPSEGVITPNDFFNEVSDLGSRGRDINNQNQVVGYIETTHDKTTSRPKAGFLFDMESEEFNNLNALLTCESKGFVKKDGKWVRNEVEVKDGTGKTLTYDSEIQIVEANSINDSGTIVGTAFIKKPSYKVDDNGNLILGDNKLPIFELSGDGKPVTAFLPRQMVIQPTGDVDDDAWKAANDCVDSTDPDSDYERKGAASLAWFLMLPLVWLRRRYK